ncbi:hypothetical protein SSME_02490 [Staphylococcus saprophyticus subsp. saprophyticus KACC 16562]|nr:hypothetical protein SSME_02490 [Staphylococcus saprophyticus subsp. saprophyticus KACC 16562]
MPGVPEKLALKLALFFPCVSLIPIMIVKMTIDKQKLPIK